MSELRGTIFTALTGRAADVSGDPGGDLRGMLLAVGGPSSKTRSGIDLTRAAQALGVSRRTCERWIQTAATGTGQRPSPGHARSLAAQARKAATTKAGRRASLAGSTLPGAITRRGARVAITGLQGPHAAGKDYLRNRTTQLDLDPGDAQAMLTAWETGGEKGFLGWATGHWDSEYVPDWTFGSVDGLQVERPYGGAWR